MVGRRAVEKALAKLQGPEGLRYLLAGVERFNGPLLQSDEQITSGQVKAEAWERAGGVRFPLAAVYCESFANEGREKFRVFSGTARLVVEIRSAGERLETVQADLEECLGAVTAVLEQERGDWGDGFSHGGQYEVKLGQLKLNGQQYAQEAKVSFALQVSR